MRAANSEIAISKLEYYMTLQLSELNTAVYAGRRRSTDEQTHRKARKVEFACEQFHCF